MPQARKDAEGDAEADDGLVTVVERMLGEGPGLWRSKKVALQSSSELAVIEGGSLQSVAATGDRQEEGELPHICEVSHPPLRWVHQGRGACMEPAAMVRCWGSAR